ncbi:claspin [Ochlerotatus camptorhynchus]|uniref:claspin n=1 Tax=Ochlerotatus camptorhynchus TaxID=644619 RepID=UPI0031E0E1C6
MDEDSNQSSRNSQQQTDPMTDESKHRESDSQMTLTYDSDSELHGEDKLRIDESDGEHQTDKALPVGISSLSNDHHSLVASPFEFESAAKEPEEHPGKLSTIEDDNSEEELISVARSRKKISQLIDTESEEEQSKQSEAVQKLTRKVSNIIDSDDSDGPVEKKQPNLDSDEHLLSKQNAEVDAIGEKIEKSMSRFKSLIDSDSASPAHDSDGESRKKKKKLKTKKERGKGKRKNKTGDPNDLLASLNLDFSDEDGRPGSGSTLNSDKEGSSGSTDSQSGSDGESRKKRNKQERKTPDEKPQRMSAKAAMEQMKVIQSESQRMAREAGVSVPYHRPKQHTLQEFLNRRTLHKSTVGSDASGGLAMGRRKAAAAIKMTPEQLAAYAKQLEEREKEAMEFFKSESDEDPTEPASVVETEEKTDVEVTPAENQISNEIISYEESKADDQNDPQAHEGHPVIDTSSNEVENEAVERSAPMDTELGESLRVSDTEEDALDALVNKTNENVELLLASQAEPEPASIIETEPEPIAGPSKETPRIDYDIFSEPTPSKLAQKKAELLSNGSITAFPSLRGNPNMIIDLDSDDQAPSGPDILFQRFAKCSGKKAKRAANLNILSTDKGVVEMSTVSLGLEQEERNPNGKEPIPGAAYAKLKQSLWEKMGQARMETLRKRQEGIRPAKKMDDEEDENNEEDIEDDEEDEIVENDKHVEDNQDEGDDKDEEEVGDAKLCDLLNDEADEDDEEAEETDQVPPEEEANDDDEDDDDDDEEESSEEESIDKPAMVNGEKKKSRIITAFEDSDEEIQGKDEAEPKAVQKTTTEELFSMLDGNDKFTPSDRNNLETGENMTLLWKDTEEPDTANTQAEDDLLALCSGRFGETQAPPPLTGAESLSTTQPMTATPSDFLALTESDRLTPESEKPTTAAAALFTQTREHPVDDSELIALCSGTFATQQQNVNLDTEPFQPSEVITKGKLVIVSSDEEDQERDVQKKKRRKPKRRNANISDDEESEEDAAEHEKEMLIDEEEAERFVDYDSEENEIEVVLTKKDKQKVASAFVENEAELSESEWGSADEDEKDLDRYDIELGDEEEFDQGKLQHELEKIHLRRMLEQDKKEVKSLQDIFFEDEEKDGVGRERQFRWRNAETTFSLDYDKKAADVEQRGEDGEGSDGEAEAQWRKMRYEREMLLKEKKIDLDKVDLTGTLLDRSMDEENEDNGSANNTTLSAMKRKITIVRTKRCSGVNTPQDSPFLITKSSFVQGHKASFLSRDEDTLNKLASLVKVNPDTEGVNTAVAGKGRNFVFAAVSPAVDKTRSKRSLDTDIDESAQVAKKTKTANLTANENGKTKKRLLLGHLM